MADKVLWSSWKTFTISQNPWPSNPDTGLSWEDLQLKSVCGIPILNCTNEDIWKKKEGLEQNIREIVTEEGFKSLYDEYDCPICLVIIEPDREITISCCNKNFCLDWVLKLLKMNNTWPMWRKKFDISNIARSTRLSTKIEELIIANQKKMEEKEAEWTIHNSKMIIAKCKDWNYEPLCLRCIINTHKFHNYIEIGSKEDYQTTLKPPKYSEISLTTSQKSTVNALDLDPSLQNLFHSLKILQANNTSTMISLITPFVTLQKYKKKWQNPKLKPNSKSPSKLDKEISNFKKITSNSKESFPEVEMYHQNWSVFQFMIGKKEKEEQVAQWKNLKMIAQIKGEEVEFVMTEQPSFPPKSGEYMVLFEVDGKINHEVQNETPEIIKILKPFKIKFSSLTPTTTTRTLRILALKNTAVLHKYIIKNYTKLSKTIKNSLNSTSTFLNNLNKLI